MKTKREYSKYWWLGFLGFFGFYKLPLIISYFTVGGSPVDLINILWFFWFLEFLPSNKEVDE